MKLMKNKKAGLSFGFFLILIATTIILGTSFVNGAPGGFYAFVDFKSMMFVLSVGLGITFAREHMVFKTQYAKLLKESFIIAGWLGFLLGFILFLHGCAEMLQASKPLVNHSTFLGLAYSLLPIFYGYNYGYFSEAILTKSVKEEKVVRKELIESEPKTNNKNPEKVTKKKTKFES